MLKKLRNKKTAKKVWIVLALIIVPAFVLWGSGSVMRSRQESTYAGKVFGRNISALEFQDALSAVKNQALMQFGDNFAQVQKQLNLEQQAWERIILLQEAKKHRIHANDQEVEEVIATLPFFQRNGHFDNVIYNEMLQYVFRTQARIFEEETRQNIILSKLYRQVAKEITLDDKEVRKEYRKFNEELSIYYIYSNPADFTKEISPSEGDLKDYFARNSLDFKQPLSFNLDYTVLESEDKVKEAVSRINKRESLEKIAKDMGTEVKETGLFGQTDPVPGIGWSADLMNLVIKLKAGQYSMPIRTDKNFYIFRLKDRKEAYIPEFDSIKDKVKERFIKDKSVELAKARIEDCYKKLKESALKNPKNQEFEKTANEMGLKSDSTGMFKCGTYLEGIGASDNLWLRAAELKENELSEITQMPSGFYILKLKSRIPIDEKKFESEKPEFGKKLLEQKRQDYFSKYIQSLVKKAQ